MPLGGTGVILGNALAGAVGAPGAAAGFFASVGSVIAAWAPANIQVKPTSMVAAGGNVSGLGTFSVVGTKEGLGNTLADALTIPPDAVDARAVWIAKAGAIISQLENYGQALGTGLTSGAPCGGKGKVIFASPVFVPTISSVLKVTDPVASVMLEAFGAVMLAHIAANADVVALSLSGPPLSAPPDGPVVGTGTIA